MVGIFWPGGGVALEGMVDGYGVRAGDRLECDDLFFLLGDFVSNGLFKSEWTQRVSMRKQGKDCGVRDTVNKDTKSLV